MHGYNREKRKYYNLAQSEKNIIFLKYFLFSLLKINKENKKTN